MARVGSDHLLTAPDVPLLLGEGTPLFDGERAELIPEGKPVVGPVTHLRFRVAKALGASGR